MHKPDCLKIENSLCDMENYSVIVVISNVQEIDIQKNLKILIFTKHNENVNHHLQLKIFII